MTDLFLISGCNNHKGTVFFMYKDMTYRKTLLLCFCNFEIIFNINQHSDVVTILQVIR